MCVRANDYVCLTVLSELQYTSNVRFNIPSSLRSKRFCGFSEQRKTEEQDFDNFAAQEMGTSEKIERGGRGEGIMDQKME